jgi:hypothetical protein
MAVTLTWGRTARLVLAAGLAFGFATHSWAETQTETARVSSAPGAILRGLDKVSGVVSEIDISVGQTVAMGKLQITLGDCRYPRDDPSGDAFAWLVIRDAGVDVPQFQGWMIASSPALNALEHPRYDVWVIRCKM